MNPENPSQPPMDDAELAAIISIYETERQDLSSLMGHALTLVGLIIAYAAAASGILSNSGDPEHILLVFPEKPGTFDGWGFAALAPLPTWMALALHTNLMALVMIHNKSANFLESKLIGLTDITPTQRKFIGAFGGDRVTNIGTQRCTAKIQSLVAYGGVAGLIIALTIFCLFLVSDRTGDGWTTATVWCSVGYSILLLAFIAAWARLFLDDRRNPLSPDGSS